VERGCGGERGRERGRERRARDLQHRPRVLGVRGDRPRVGPVRAGGARGREAAARAARGDERARRLEEPPPLDVDGRLLVPAAAAARAAEAERRRERRARAPIVVDVAGSGSARAAISATSRAAAAAAAARHGDLLGDDARVDGAQLRLGEDGREVGGRGGAGRLVDGHRDKVVGADAALGCAGGRRGGWVGGGFGAAWAFRTADHPNKKLRSNPNRHPITPKTAPF
jgi:hypothetical protein